MSWSHFSNKGTRKVQRASAAEVLACFQGKKDLLFRLAFLIIGNEASAERSVNHRSRNYLICKSFGS